MFRKDSISQITSFFGAAEEQALIGKEISRPTKSFATRAWAADFKMNDDGNPNNKTEFKHLHMQLLAERARVQELEKNLKSMTEQKFSNQSQLINQLQSSQNKLREQLHLVVQSKMDLCESTAFEIDRLRCIISSLTDSIHSITGKTPDIHAIQTNIDKYTKNDNNNNNNDMEDMKQAFYIDDEDGDGVMSTGHVTRGGPNDNDNNNNNDDIIKENTQQNTQNNNNNNALFDDSNEENKANLPAHLQPFPHKDISRIDIRTMTPGDGITYADPFAAVDLKYTGYKYLRVTDQWTKFTSSNISNTVFETRLGNHENIIGLEQAVLSMTKGEVARVWVPSRLGYGVHGAEPLIPPNTDLIFELTLVEIRNDFMSNQDNDPNDPLDPLQAAEMGITLPIEEQYNSQMQASMGISNEHLNDHYQEQPYETLEANNDDNQMLYADDDHDYGQGQQPFQVL